jgi:hypothetical protein
MTAGAALALGAGLTAGGGLAPRSAFAAKMSDSETKPNVVLVHGAWADGSSWDEVTALLLQAGYPVTCVAIPLSALADDVARTQAVLALQAGPRPMTTRRSSPRRASSKSPTATSRSSGSWRGNRLSSAIPSAG